MPLRCIVRQLTSVTVYVLLVGLLALASLHQQASSMASTWIWHPCRFLAATDPRLQKLRQFSHSPVTWFRNPFVHLVVVSPRV